MNFSLFLANELKLLGCKVYRDKINNIYAYFKGNNKKGKTILLNAHIDTVTHDKKIRPRILHDGIICSYGDTILGADNKAGVAVILEVLKALKEEKAVYPNIQIIFTVQEEVGLLGARQIKKSKLKAKVGFVLDGGDIDTIYNAAPCQYNLYAEIFGRSAHAGVHPEDGVNAIKVASDAISKMKLGRIDFETTANIGIIEGGKATNIVPDRVLIKGEARSHNMKKLKNQVKHMKESLLSSCLKYKARLKIKFSKVYDSFLIKEEDDIVELTKKSLDNIGIKPKIAKTGGGSDANVFNELGIKTLIIGVGADKIHTNFENIKIKDLYDGARFLVKVVKNNV